MPTGLKVPEPGGLKPDILLPELSVHTATLSLSPPFSFSSLSLLLYLISTRFHSTNKFLDLQIMKTMATDKLRLTFSNFASSRQNLTIIHILILKIILIGRFLIPWLPLESITVSRACATV